MSLNFPSTTYIKKKTFHSRIIQTLHGKIEPDKLKIETSKNKMICLFFVRSDIFSLRSQVILTKASCIFLWIEL